MPTLMIVDETPAGKETAEATLEFPSDRVTVRELIRGRVYQEVQDYNLKQPEYFKGLVQPTDAEATLNGFKLRKARKVDWQKQFDKAIQSFESNGFMLLVKSHQVESLDEEVEIKADTKVSFVKLTPLVGG